MDNPIAMGGMLKAIAGHPDRVGGYLVMWGSPAQRDLQGEYFTPETDFQLDNYPVRPAYYHHGLDATLKANRIGIIDTLKTDEVGLWAEAQLEMHNAYIEKIKELVARGVLGWSSGSAPNLVEIDSSGKIKCWPIIEGSMTPSPAEPRGTTIQPLKTFLQEHPVQPLDAFIPAEPDAAKEADTPKEPTPLAAKDVPVIPTESESATKMNPKEILIQGIQATLQLLGATLDEAQVNALADQLAAGMQPADATAAVPAEQVGAVATQVAPALVKAVNEALAAHQAAKAQATAAVNGAVKQALAATAIPIKEVGGYSAPANHIELRTKYADMSELDMSYYAMLQQGRRRALPPEFLKEFADRATKAYTEGKLKFGDKDETKGAIKGLNAIKADELNYSTQANYGDEVVPNVWSSQIWDKARMDNVIFQLFKSVEMPSNPFELPVESTDPTVYLVPESTNEAQLTRNDANNPTPDSKVGTAKVTLTAKKLGLRTEVSAELEEDSIIPFIPQLRAQAERALQDAMDNVLLNGDTATGANTNINLIDGTPAGTAKYLAFNGLRKLWAVTTTANAEDGNGGALTLAMIRNARFKLDRGYSARLNRLALITHPEAYAKMLGLSEFITMDKAGNLATAQTGQLGIVDGMPVFVSAEYALTNSVGKIPNAGGTLGSLTIAALDAWVIGFRRRVTVNVEYIAGYDVHELTANLRLAFIARDADCASGVMNFVV